MWFKYSIYKKWEMKLYAAPHGKSPAACSSSVLWRGLVWRHGWGPGKGERAVNYKMWMQGRRGGGGRRGHLVIPYSCTKTSNSEREKWKHFPKWWNKLVDTPGRIRLVDVLDFMFHAEKRNDPSNRISHTRTRHPAATCCLVLIQI